MSDPSDLTHEVDCEIARADKLLRVRDAARRWNCTARTVQRLIANGRVPHVRIGPTQRIRIRESVVSRFEARDGV